MKGSKLPAAAPPGTVMFARCWVVFGCPRFWFCPERKPPADAAVWLMRLAPSLILTLAFMPSGLIVPWTIMVTPSWSLSWLHDVRVTVKSHAVCLPFSIINNFLLPNGVAVCLATAPKASQAVALADLLLLVLPSICRVMPPMSASVLL